MPTTHAFRTVDVFTHQPLKGNPLAVVFSAETLSDETMQAFAHWTNLSETTFLLPPTDLRADYRVRIFTPRRELLFAGHPTIGSCHAWLEAGGKPRAEGEVVQECGVGLVRLRRGADTLAFAAPPMRSSEIQPDQLRDMRDALGLTAEQLRDASLLDNGLEWPCLLVDSAETVLSLEPDHAALARLGSVGVVGPHEPGRECQFEVRAFTDSAGAIEDPVTGSLNASLAQWLIGSGRAPRRYVAAQGTRLQRAGRVYIEAEGEAVWVGGGAVTCVSGNLRL
jgi:PhzF family phenazine biosynthesis protein